MIQKILRSDNGYEDLKRWIRQYEKVLLVCGSSIDSLKVYEALKSSGISERIIRFSGFEPNPDYSSVIKGIELYRKESCDAIMAIGGGSAMDVAKCIRLFSVCNSDGSAGEFLEASDDELGSCQDVPLLAMPTTAGTGSEATRYAVVYYGGEKQSITSRYIIPPFVLLDSSVLETLPEYQKKSTMLDALCHAVESYWSINSTEESMGYSRAAIKAVIGNMSGYLGNTEECNRGMLMAAYMAGKAINITQTTAGHAMCYKITGLFGLSHGHAAALCDRVLYKWMVRSLRNGGMKVIDPRGEAYLEKVMEDISSAFGCASAEEGADRFAAMFDELGLSIPVPDEQQMDILIRSVNPVRLKNHPVEMDVDTIKLLYRKIFEKS